MLYGIGLYGIGTAMQLLYLFTRLCWGIVPANGIGLYAYAIDTGN